MSHIYKMDLGRDNVFWWLKVQYVYQWQYKVFILAKAKKIEIKATYEAF